MDMEVATIDSRNYFIEAIPLPVFKLFGVCNLMFIWLNFLTTLTT